MTILLYIQQGNWYEANRYCALHNLTLIDVLSSIESERLSWIVRDEDYSKDKQLQFWTSGSDLGSINNFYWMSNGQHFNFTNWNSNKYPIISNSTENLNSDRSEINKNRHCVVINKSIQLKWTVEDCNEEKFFVCKKILQMF